MAPERGTTAAEHRQGGGQVAAPRTCDQAEDADYLSAYETNVLSVVRCVRRLVPAMRERGWGRIITISTRAAVTPLANMVEFSAAKAAVVNLTGSLARHLAGSNPTGRLGRPDDVAAATVFLASPRAGYVNGATVRVDGGLTGTVNP